MVQKTGKPYVDLHQTGYALQIATESCISHNFIHQNMVHDKKNTDCDRCTKIRRKKKKKTEKKDKSNIAEHFAVILAHVNTSPPP